MAPVPTIINGTRDLLYKGTYMRLTLRTMLAYLDDVLESDDGQEIGEKVDESQFATDLSHRIRGCVRRLRLPAPPLDGKGMGLDPNTVAEYLDSTLPDEQVPDFEKMCLDSDLQLAETASCHQILTLVLGEPAQIEPSTRERIYRIGQTEVQHNQQPITESSDAATAVEPRRKPEIPDYLRDDPRSSWWPVAATFLFAALVTLGLFRLAGPFDRSHPVFQALTKSDADGQSPFPPSPYEAESSDGFHVEPDRAYIDDVHGLEPSASKSLGEANQVETTVESLTADSEYPEITQRGTSSRQPETGKSSSELLTDAPTENTPGDTGVAVATALVPVADDSADVDPGAGSLPSKNHSAEGVEPDTASADPIPTADNSSAEPIDIGRFLSDEEVLIRLDPESSTWQRLSPRSVLFAQDKLLALPTYRPLIWLGTGVQLTVFGGTQIGMSGTAAKPFVQVDFGRLLLVPVGRDDARVSLRLPGRDVDITFVSAESALAVEVLRVHTPGVDPRQRLPHNLVRLIPTTGGVEITADSSSAQTVMAGASWLYFDAAQPDSLPIDENPDWIDGGDLRDIDRIASQIIESALSYERPVGLTLAEKTEATQERRIEARTLAVRSLTYLDEFEPAIKSLADSQHRKWWQMHFAALQDSLARSPETADRVMTALQKHRGQHAELLLKLLSGYSPDELQAGGAAELVGYLNHDKLDFRVLANENLRLITGTRPIYNPADTPAKRKRSIRRWQDKLEQGLIVYKNPPLDISPSKRSTNESTNGSQEATTDAVENTL